MNGADQSSPAQRGLSFLDVISSLPSFGLSGLYFVTWISPLAIDTTMISYLMLVMLMEFIIMHSSAFMVSVAFEEIPRNKKVLRVAGLSLFYILFVAGFSAAFQTWWPMVAFLVLTLNRLLGLLIGKEPTGEEKNASHFFWGFSALMYIVLAAVTTIFPVPGFGITGEVVQLQEFSGDGLWEVEPQRVIAFGFLYFGAICLYDLFSSRWTSRTSLLAKRTYTT